MTKHILQPSLEPSGEITDPYKVIAATLFKIPYEQVTPEQREYAKQAAYRDLYTTPIDWGFLK